MEHTGHRVDAQAQQRAVQRRALHGDGGQVSGAVRLGANWPDDIGHGAGVRSTGFVGLEGEGSGRHRSARSGDEGLAQAVQVPLVDEGRRERTGDVSTCCW